MSYRTAECEIEVGHGAKYRIHASPRSDERNLGDIITRVKLGNGQGMVTIYSSGEVVLETPRSAIRYSLTNGSLQTL